MCDLLRVASVWVAVILGAAGVVVGGDFSAVVLVDSEVYPPGCFGDDFNETLAEVGDPLCAAAYALATELKVDRDDFGQICVALATELGERGYDGILAVSVEMQGKVGVAFYGSAPDSCQSVLDASETDPWESLRVKFCANRVVPGAFHMLMDDIAIPRRFTYWNFVGPLFSLVMVVDSGELGCWGDSYASCLEFLSDPLAAAGYAAGAVWAECSDETFEQVCDDAVGRLQGHYGGSLDMVVTEDGMAGVAFYGFGETSLASIEAALGVDPNGAGVLIEWGEGRECNANAGDTLRDLLGGKKSKSMSCEIGAKEGVVTYAIVDARESRDRLGSYDEAVGLCGEPVSAGLWWTAEEYDWYGAQDIGAMSDAYFEMSDYMEAMGYCRETMLVSGGPFVAVAFIGYAMPGIEVADVCDSIEIGLRSYGGVSPIVCECVGSRDLDAGFDYMDLIRMVQGLDGRADLCGWSWMNPGIEWRHSREPIAAGDGMRGTRTFEEIERDVDRSAFVESMAVGRKLVTK